MVGVPAGRRVLELTGNGLYYREEVTIPTDDNATVAPRFVEIGSIAYDLPSGATATITGPDGERRTLRGNGTLANQPTGRYAGSITGLGSSDQTVTLTLDRGGTITVAPATGVLRVTSTPSGASVYIDGRYRGTTPLTVEDLTPGSVSYRLSKSGYEDEEGTRVVSAGRTLTVTETMTAEVPTYEIGDRGPAGGIVFYDKGEYTDGWRYLEAWTSDEAGAYDWKTSRTSTGGTSTAIGSGYANTYSAMTGSEHPAAEVCRNATHGGFSDWFLPSKDELDRIVSGPVCGWRFRVLQLLEFVGVW